MLSKCANPSCSTPFVYLRDGKIFTRNHITDTSSRTAAQAVTSVSRVEHFWLCGRCSEDFTLVHDPVLGVQLVGKKARPKRAAA